VITTHRIIYTVFLILQELMLNYKAFIISSSSAASSNTTTPQPSPKPDSNEQSNNLSSTTFSSSHAYFRDVMAPTLADAMCDLISSATFRIDLKRIAGLLNLEGVSYPSDASTKL
jgi:hypothetical protein